MLWHHHVAGHDKTVPAAHLFEDIEK